MELIELIIKEKDKDGVNAISLVEKPAIKSDFIALSEKKPNFEFAEIDEEQYLLVGPALIPEIPIVRMRNDKKVNVFFSKETVKEASQLYFKNKFQDQVTEHHKFGIQDVVVVESWIVEDEEKDKSRFYGLEVPKGTWMVAMKCYNKEVYERAKKGEFKGFSIEAFFKDKEIDTTQELEEAKQMLSEISKDLELGLTDEEIENEAKLLINEK